MAGGGIYSVKKGDTLWAISQAILGTPIYAKDIAILNRLPNSNLILTGMKLKIPVVGNKPPPTHTPAGGASAYPKAPVILCPTVEYDLSKFPAQTYILAGGKAEVKFFGKLKMTKRSTIVAVDISNPRSPVLSGELKKEYETELGRTVVKHTVELKKGVLEFKSALSASVGGLKVSMSPDSSSRSVKFKASTSPKQLSLNGWTYDGDFGFEITLTYIGSVPDWKSIAAVAGLVVVVGLGVLAAPLIVPALAAVGGEAVAYMSAATLLASVAP